MAEGTLRDAVRGFLVAIDNSYGERDVVEAVRTFLPRAQEHVSAYSSDPTEPVLTLRSLDLMSKWGFQDGNYPDEIRDVLEEELEIRDLDWRDVLVDLVQRHLIPALVEHQRIEVVLYRHPIHNPITVAYIDGEEVTSTSEPPQDGDPVLSDVTVTVTMPEILAAVARAQAVGRRRDREQLARRLKTLAEELSRGR